jgi:hypothetical protein
MTQASISIIVPAPPTVASSVRRAAYISPAAQSVAISSYAVINGVIAGTASATSDQNLTSVSPGCSGTGAIACTITVPVPAGHVAFSVTVYQGLGETGAVLSSLPQSTATEYTIVEGSANIVLPLVLGGVPNSILVTPAASSVTGGTAASFPVTVTAYDASGNIIIGAAAYANAITLTDSDTSGATSVTPSTVTAPTTAVTFAFNGEDFTSPLTVSAAATGASDTPGAIASLPGPLLVACSSGCSGLNNGTTPYAQTITEAGYGTGTFTLSGSGTACTADPAGSVAASGGAANVNIYPNPAGGTCMLVVTDSYSQTHTATLTFNAAANPAIVTNCGYSFIYPPDPFGGTLHINNGCGTEGVQYGSYLSIALDSNQNPPDSFVIATYANPNEAAVSSFTNNTNRYITGASIAGSDVDFNGQNGTSQVPFLSFIP